MQPILSLLIAVISATTVPPHCDPATYLRDGAWLERRTGPLELPARCTLDPSGELQVFDHIGLRYACNDSEPDRRRYQWWPKPPCTRPSWARIMRPNRTVWVVGDSMSMQMAFVLHCSLAGVAEWHPPSWGHLLQISGRDARNHRIAGCALSSDGGQLCYLPAGTNALTVAAALHVVIEHGNAVSSDVALVNSGVWQMGHARGDVYQRKMVESLLKLASHADCPRLFWRESFAQHFPSVDGIWSPQINITATGCTGRPSAQPPILREVAVKLGAHPRVTVLPSWHSTQHLAAAHYGAGDCSHFCTWSGALQATLDAFAWGFEALGD
ncbi:hypothetical protein T492DRAFT_946285 [Pavlovales sp. CCMP2436]|nr:hypothetical protein T492DRAFT_946285 [Pavlovales sp. CCMP2436]|mmetsp:Transcript_12743/g.32306  ORF Transcript_12743/g.32306 Transcript_12743/m.32306 type:complete len:326 (-) Transcript_12743:61-1038(-)